MGLTRQGVVASVEDFGVMAEISFLASLNTSVFCSFHAAQAAALYIPTGVTALWA